MIAPLADRLRARVIVDLAGCWIWQGARDPAGYGAIKIDGRKVNAHRLAYELWVGPVPPGRIVLHSCHNAACINPDHLRAGTRADNIADARRAGKNLAPRVTPELAASIRRSRKPAAWLAQRHGLAFSTVAKIRNGSTHRSGRAA